MKKTVISILIFALFVGTSVAAQTLPRIYIMDDMFLGVHRDMSVDQRMSISEIENAAKQSERMRLIYMEGDELKESKNGAVYPFCNKPSSTLYLDSDMFDTFSDEEYYENELYERIGIYDNIHDIMYKQNAYEYEINGNIHAKEVWLFGDKNVYIADAAVDEADIRINDLCTYDEWYDAQEYKPEGKCMVNDTIVSEGIYANGMECKVPLRAVAESIGGIVEWSDEDYSASIYYGNKTYTLDYFPGVSGYMGGLSLKIDGTLYALGRESGTGNYYMENGTTYLSYYTAEKLFENMNVQLYYNPETKILKVMQ